MSREPTMRVPLLILGILCLAATGVHAEIYQYKDENGKTVFSERPPAKGTASSIVKPKAGRTVSGAADKLKQDRERILPSEQAAKSGAGQKPELTPEQEEQKARACAQAQQALTALRENNRPRFETENGQIAHMTPEMQAERVADAEEKVGKYCAE